MEGWVGLANCTAYPARRVESHVRPSPRFACAVPQGLDLETLKWSRMNNLEGDVMPPCAGHQIALVNNVIVVVGTLFCLYSPIAAWALHDKDRSIGFEFWDVSCCMLA